MAIQQTKQQSDLEKRLKILRRQMYGKNPGTIKTTVNQDVQKSAYRYTGSTTSSETHIADLKYLNQDLLKILIFSSSAIVIQFVLFFALKNHILNINFF